VRWLAALALLTGCGPVTCQQVAIGIFPHPTQPRPAGRVLVQCDGKAVLMADAATVTR
jgi:hypothetical protein